MVYALPMDQKTIVENACKAAGGQPSLAKLLGISEQAVSKWKRNGVPAERVLEIERLTEKRVTRHELRPDLYPEQ